MRTIALVLATILSIQTFCTQLQQTSSAATMDNEGAVNVDVNDSDVFFQAALQRRKPARDYGRRIEALISRMTLEEKVGQMTQLEIGMVSTGQDQAIQLDSAKLEKAVLKYGVGSILNVNSQALTIDRWHEVIRQIQETSQRSRLKIPVIYGIDSIHGANYVQGATLFPQEIGMAATWNPALMQRAAEITGSETRAAGIPWSFSPVLDIGRQPLWPRFWETFGEDPYLAQVMGVAFVRGLEGDDVSSSAHVAASLKHYMGYSFPLNGRDRTSAWIPENYLREYFLPTFAAAVRAGARTVMVNSAEINGVPGHINRHILTDILHGELDFQGFVVSDWEDIKKLVTQWKVAADEKEATRLAVMAGIDMSMVPSDYSFADHLLALVKEGKVPMARINEAVGRILRVKFELGLFENAMPDPALKSKLGTNQSRDVALQAARESMTLLKNENGLLPLNRNRKVLVTGPTAHSLISLNNGWTYVWQGSEESLYPKDRPTILQAIEGKLGKNVTYVPGTRITRAAGSPSNTTPTDVNEEVDIAAAARAARDADVVVLCLGEGSYAETPGNITDLTLSEVQLRLAEAIQATGKPVVLVLVEGRPRIINRITDKAGAILMAYNPGNEGGTAIADVLFGDYNPSGKLPFTYPRTPNGLVTYDHKLFETEATSYGNMAFNPQFEFGHGLSYTTFTYSNLRLGQKTMAANGTMGVSVTVTNSGQRAGKEAIILYVRDVVASLSPPGKRVRRFAKVYLEPGQSRTLTFTLRRDDLSFIGADNRPTVEPGDFDVMVGNLTDKFTLQAEQRQSAGRTQRRSRR
ncbi:MAG TPA: glycoside hydrolase family 3 N-terminal domain-containing protein [Pyrinomonadaceae bacterium]|nr:glycoside hydrolase family 3 N-terminal domain-containing protein [Pyrinomonadaceae bacterium]